MSNEEQTIYISPEDDLTNVRERLEKLPSRRITLVIPRQTLLRSHVAWRNLYARAKELEKDVLIISADAQIRSLAQAAKFRVAHSLEAAPTVRSRAGMSRPARSNPNARARSSTPLRSTNRNASSGTNAAPDSIRSRSTEPDQQHSAWTTHENERSSFHPGPESTRSRSGETTTGGLANPASTYHLSDQAYEQPFNYRIDTPSIHPLSQEQVEEEPDMLLEDYRQVQDIRHNALQGQSQGQERTIDNTMPSPAPSTQAPKTPASGPLIQPEQPTHRITPLPHREEDPFFYMEDALPAPRLEQRGAVSMDDFSTAEHPIQDISERPTDVMHDAIEYQGDQGDFVRAENEKPSVKDWIEAIPEDEQDMAGPSRVYGVRPRSSRTGKPQQPAQDFFTDDALPPIEERPTQVTPQKHPSQQLPPASAPLRPVPAPAPLPITGNTRPSQKTGAVRKQAPAPVPAAKQPVQRPGANRTGASRTGGATTKVLPPQSQRKQARQGLRGGAVFIAIAILLLVILGLIAYVYPTADITVTVASHSYSSNVTLTSDTSGTKKLGIVPATLLTQTFQKTGTGNVSGSTKTATARATGLVTFTNQGTANVDIPTGTIVQTALDVQFATTADALVAPNNTIPTQVQAQQTGEVGNVAAGTITVIPTSSISVIAGYPGNPSATNIKLKVNNDNATSGGGIGTASAVSQGDIDTEKQALRTQLQSDVDTWLKQQQVQPTDIAGQPTFTETLVNAPTVGQPIDNGSFTMGLKLAVTLLVVRNANLQQAAVASLNDSLSRSKQTSNANYEIIADASHPVVIENLKKSQKGNTLTLAFTAKGQTTPRLQKNTVQKLVIGKTKRDAVDVLKQNIPGVQTVAIKTNPDFITWLPTLEGHINVKFIPGTPTQK